MLRNRSKAAPVLPLLLGSALLAGQALWNVSWREGIGWPATPLDRSTARALVPGYALLASAQRLIPPGAAVVVRTEPPDAAMETRYHRLAVSLLPGRRALPSALLDRFTPPEAWRDAQYLVLVGPPPASPQGHLLLEAPQGTVWRRPRS